MGARQSSSRGRNSEEFFQYISANSSLLPHTLDRDNNNISPNMNNSRHRTRSLFTSLNSSNFDDISLPPSSNNLSPSSPNCANTSSTSANNPGNSSSALNALISQRLLALTQSMHSSIFSYEDIKCPVCTQKLPSDDIEYHLLLCLTKPRIHYNEEKLTEDKGECAICLDDMNREQTIARLPCLCIYHKGCIDKWFLRSRSCPEHPVD